MKEVQELVEEINRNETTVGQLETVVAMYPPHHQDPYLESVREALRIIEEQGKQQS